MTDSIQEARGVLPEPIPSDATNLADDRIACQACAGEGYSDEFIDTSPTAAPGKAVFDVLPCAACHGKGSIVRPTGRDHLSHSALAAKLNCPQRYAFAWEARLEPKERVVPKALGSAYQKAIEEGDPEAGVALLHEKAPVPLTAELQRQLKTEEAIVRGASTLYLATWGKPARAEFEYRVRLRNPWTGAYSRTFDLLGYADGLEDKGSWWELVENKLVGQVTATSIRKLKLDRQLALECYGIWRATGKPVREVRYRFMRKPSIKQRGGRKKDKSDAETLDQFVERIGTEYAERADFYAHEEHLLVGTDDLVRIEAELWQWASEMREARRSHIWPRNSSWCHEYGGCPFLALCLGDPDAESLYRVRPERPVDAESLPE